jgi:heterodisulfide reductase subunit A
LASTKVCVIGAGVSGISVANNLTQAGVDVVLVDRNPYPGGQSVFYGCKATDECVRCGVCLVREAVATLKNEPAAQCLFSSRPVGFRTEDGLMELDIQTRANPIDWYACVECGRCVQACPQRAIEKVPGWKYFVNESCTSCGECVDACPVGAISLDRSTEQATVQVNGVVLAAGYEPFDPAINRKWGYGANPRVLTGSQMEKLFFQEKYLPQAARNIAFVQCVGSRSLVEGEKHCSRVCCPYALRMAGRLKQQYPDLNIDFYYMDIQRFGKNFEEFWDQIQGKINLIASNPISIKTDEKGLPVIRYESLPELACREQSYDLVVLSNGITPAKESESLADLFNLDLDTAGFLSTAVRQTSVAGSRVFTAGTCKRPMRIDDCVEDAAAVSNQVMHTLGVQV